MDTSPMPQPSSEFTDHYRAHFDFTWRNLGRLGVPPTELDDAAQEVFVVLLRKRASIPPELPIRAWLFGVIRRIAWRYRRSDTRRSLLRDAVDRTAIPRPEVGTTVNQRPDDLYDTREAARLVERFIGELTPIQAEVFVLAELEEMSGKEIAKVLGVNQNTVWSRLRLARRAFDQRFTPHRAEGARLSKRSPAANRRHPVLSLSRRGHRPSTDDRRRVGALLGIPGFGALPPGQGTSAGAPPPPPPLTAAAAATASTSTGATLAGLAGAAVIAALVVGVGLFSDRERERDRSATAPTSEERDELIAKAKDDAQVDEPSAGAVEQEKEKEQEQEQENHLGLSLPPTTTPQIPLPRPPARPEELVHAPGAEQTRRAEPTDRADVSKPAPLNKDASSTPPPQPVGGDGGTPPLESALGAEYDLLAAARAALAGHDPRQCLAIAERHRRDFPGGILRDERDGLRITALCQLGRDGEARRLTDQLAPRLQEPEAVRRFTAACDEMPPP